jgi:5-methylcytosine-specific restriction protein A
MRNPAWTRDELILAIDLYFRCGRRQLEATHPDVIALSGTLNAIGAATNVLRNDVFRNPNGVHMKLGNFSAIDPEKAGVGLSRGNKLERVVWSEFSSDPARLRAVAQAIAKIATAPDTASRNEALQTALQPQEEFPEGALLTKVHLSRERNRKLVEQKKKLTLAENGKLACECCEFDFASFYGPLGNGFAECHHITPLSSLASTRKTKLADLAIVCANCHRMLHRSGNHLTIVQLRDMLTALQPPHRE